MEDLTFSERSLIRADMEIGIERLNSLINSKYFQDKEAKNYWYKQKIERINCYLKLYKLDFN